MLVLVVVVVVVRGVWGGVFAARCLFLITCALFAVSSLLPLDHELYREYSSACAALTIFDWYECCVLFGGWVASVLVQPVLEMVFLLLVSILKIDVLHIGWCSGLGLGSGTVAGGAFRWAGVG